MELIKKRVHMSKCNGKTMVSINLNDDFNVPDAKPDALSLIKEQGDIVHCELTTNGSKVVLKGEIAFTVLYVGDEPGHPVCNYMGTLPFEETITLAERENEDETTARCRIEELRGELINSRKIGMKAVISANVMSECVYDGEGAVGIQGEDVYVKEKSFDIAQLMLSKKDTFRYRDQWTLPATRSAIHQILYSQVSVREMTTRLQEDKITLNGQGRLFVLYQTAEEPRGMDFFETTFPIQGSVDCSGCDENMIPNIEVEIHSKEVTAKEDEDGEMRQFVLELVLNMYIKAYQQEKMQVLEDFYCTDHIVHPVFKTSYFENLIMKNETKARFTGKIKALEGEPVLQVWSTDGELKIESETVEDDGLQVKGILEVSVLYVTEADGQYLANVKENIPFEQRVEIPGLNSDSLYYLNASIDDLTSTVLADQEIEVKAVVSLDVTAFDRMALPIIADYTEEEMDGAKRSQEPGLVAYIAKPGDTLWDIAKNFFTTKEAIMELNEMDSEKVSEGDMILLLKETHTIGAH